MSFMQQKQIQMKMTASFVEFQKYFIVCCTSCGYFVLCVQKYQSSHALSMRFSLGFMKSNGVIPSRHPIEIPRDEPENLAAAKVTT